MFIVVISSKYQVASSEYKWLIANAIDFSTARNAIVLILDTSYLILKTAYIEKSVG